MITKDKVTEIFCIIDECDKELDGELKRNVRLPAHNGKGKRYRNRKGRLSESEVMTILICYHFYWHLLQWKKHRLHIEGKSMNGDAGKRLNNFEQNGRYRKLWLHTF